jgi:hypothetical protein
MVDSVHDGFNQRTGELTNKVQSKFGSSRDVGVA